VIRQIKQILRNRELTVNTVELTPEPQVSTPLTTPQVPLEDERVKPEPGEAVLAY
jgi:hypothetical protein